MREMISESKLSTGEYVRLLKIGRKLAGEFVDKKITGSTEQLNLMGLLEDPKMSEENKKIEEQERN